MSDRPANKIYRTEAMEHLSAPDQLDQLLQVVGRKSWFPIIGLGVTIALALVWSIVGQIPVTVEGRGYLVYPNRMKPFQSPAAGRISILDIRLNDPVEKGQVLGQISQPELEQRIVQEGMRLAYLEQRYSTLRTISEAKLDSERELIEKNRRRLEARIKSTSEQAKRERTEAKKYFSQQSESLTRIREVTGELGVAVAKQTRKFQELASEGNATELEVLDAQRIDIEHKVQFADLELRIREIDLRRLAMERSYQRQMDLIDDLESELQELVVQDAKSRHLFEEFTSDSDLSIQESRQQLARYQNELLTKGVVKSEFDGHIIEVTGSVGQIVGEGDRIGAIAIESKASKLQAVICFEVSDGKKINPGMPMHISPTTVQRERWGSIWGKVKDVSERPVTTAVVTKHIGNAEVARHLTAGSDKIEVFADLDRDSSDPPQFRWTSGKGPDTPLTVGTPVTATVIIGTRRPISYLIPGLRQLSGV